MLVVHASTLNNTYLFIYLFIYFKSITKYIFLHTFPPSFYGVAIVILCIYGLVYKFWSLKSASKSFLLTIPLYVIVDTWIFFLLN